MGYGERIFRDGRHDGVAAESEDCAERDDGVAAVLEVLDDEGQGGDGIGSVAAGVVEEDDVAELTVFFNFGEDLFGRFCMPISGIEVVGDCEETEFLSGGKE